MNICLLSIAVKRAILCYTLVIWKSCFQCRSQHSQEITPQDGTIISVLVQSILEKPSMDPELFCRVSSASFKVIVRLARKNTRKAQVCNRKKVMYGMRNFIINIKSTVV